MLPDAKVMCPATGFKKSCRAINAEFDCPKFVHLLGSDPATGVPQDKHGCVDSFLPLLMLENSQQQRQTAAAVESLRNVIFEGMHGATARVATERLAEPTRRLT